jgi:hydroxymethylbilane synthase
MNLRIATRKSPLALWQAQHVKDRLERAHPGLAVDLVPMVTSGDTTQGPLPIAAGGKGLFVKELEEALLDGRADLAVHSMKDVPVRQPAGLALAAFLAAEDPRDAFVSVKVRSLAELPRGARVGTSSLRRQSQLRAERPDVAVADLRGNVGTRLARLDEGRFDAVLLACAGLLRLGAGARITERLAPERFVPAVGQGIIGIECREDDAGTRARIAPLNDAASTTRLAAERALNAKLGGSCRVPVAGHAVLKAGLGQEIHLTGLVAAPDGSRIIKSAIDGAASEAAALGTELGELLLRAGGAEILRSIGVHIA